MASAPQMHSIPFPLMSGVTSISLCSVTKLRPPRKRIPSYDRCKQLNLFNLWKQITRLPLFSSCCGGVEEGGSESENDSKSESDSDSEVQDEGVMHPFIVHLAVALDVALAVVLALPHVFLDASEAAREYWKPR